MYEKIAVINKVVAGDKLLRSSPFVLQYLGQGRRFNLAYPVNAHDRYM